MIELKLISASIVVSTLACAAAADDAAAPHARPKFDQVVKIEFPKEGYTYTLAEAAKGIKIEYKIIVAQDY